MERLTALLLVSLSACASRASFVLALPFFFLILYLGLTSRQDHVATVVSVLATLRYSAAMRLGLLRALCIFY